MLLTLSTCIYSIVIRVKVLVIDKYLSYKVPVIFILVVVNVIVFVEVFNSLLVHGSSPAV